MAELVVLTGARAGAVFELPDIPTVVGRSPEAHFQLDDPWISSMHAMFERRGDELWVVDLESRNGTFLGEERVQEALLPAGAVLRFGRTEVRFQRERSRPRDPPTPRPCNTTPLPPSRPTSRLDAPAITGPHGVLQARPPADPLPLAPRTVTLLRLALHLRPELAAPEPDRVHAALERLERAARDEGGLAVRHGAGVLAVFGPAGSTPRDGELALRAARAALAAVERLGDGFTARAAIDEGAVLVGNAGGAEGFELAALGEVAERTERILWLAAPGEILVGPGAAALAGLEPATWMQVGAMELRVARAGR
ncbi:MAG TPA: FHA domain-containing protein [Anaeromyxobacter sp.]|nr:FHA domain-containing protein [Anaeromyxobacter sp.]